MVWWLYVIREVFFIGSSGVGLVRVCEIFELIRLDFVKLKFDDLFFVFVWLILICNGVLGRGGMYFILDMWGMDLGFFSLISMVKYFVFYCKLGILWYIFFNVFF